MNDTPDKDLEKTSEQSGEQPGRADVKSESPLLAAKRSRGLVRRAVPAAICIALVIVTIAVFGRVAGYEFVNYDDGDYVYQNPIVANGLSAQGIKWAFTSTYAGNWHPVTWLSLMLDCSLFGPKPGGLHLVNLALHVISTLLLFVVLMKMTRAVWASAFVAAVFALHPLHVESVTWIAERKDVLSTVFWMLTMLAYAYYVERPKVGRFALVVIAFTLGLMAKPMLVTVPFVLLLLDYWPLKRVRPAEASEAGGEQTPHPSAQTPQRLLREKLPLFALAVVSSTITIFAQQGAGAVTTMQRIGLLERVANVPVSYATYIAKMFVPLKLAPFYPYPQSIPVAFAVASAVVLVVVSILVVRLADRYGYATLGWFWYVGTLIPVIGIIQVGDQAMADRYTYVPLIGIFIIIAFAVRDLIRKLPQLKAVCAFVAVAAVAALWVAAHLQARYWQNSFTLFEHALAVTENNYVAHYCLSEPLRSQGRVDEAIEHCREALAIRPDYVEAMNGLGIALVEDGKAEEAAEQFKKALRVKPNLFAAHMNLGSALLDTGDVEKATEHLRAAVQLRSTPTARIKLAEAFVFQQRFDLAAEQLAKVLELEPNDPFAHYSLASAYVRLGQNDKAVQHLARAIELKPDFVTAYNDLGYLLMHTGGVQQAVACFSRALEYDPTSAKLHYNLGVALTGMGKFDEAVAQYNIALDINPDYASVHNDLAAVLIRLGRLDEAKEHLERTLELEPEHENAWKNLEFVLSLQQQRQQQEKLVLPDLNDIPVVPLP